MAGLLSGFWPDLAAIRALAQDRSFLPPPDERGGTREAPAWMEPCGRAGPRVGGNLGYACHLCKAKWNVYT